GGRISVESEPGRGRTFFFTVRFDRDPKTSKPVAAQVPVKLHGLSVLVAESNATSRRLFEEWLRASHPQPTLAENSSSALHALRQAADAGHPFALVVLDSRLPGTKTLAFAEQVRQTPELVDSKILLLATEDQARELSRYKTLGTTACV